MTAGHDLRTRFLRVARTATELDGIAPATVREKMRQALAQLEAEHAPTVETHATTGEVQP